VLLSIKDRTMYISTGKGIKEVITDALLDDIIDRMKPHLRENRIYEAILFAVESFRDILNGTYESNDNANENDVFYLIFFHCYYCLLPLWNEQVIDKNCRS